MGYKSVSKGCNSFWVRFHGVLWFDFGLEGRFPVKMAKNGHILHHLDTPTPRRRSACLGIELHLGKPEVKFPIVLIGLGVAVLLLGVTASHVFVTP